jgi:hypothetical protein
MQTVSPQAPFSGATSHSTRSVSFSSNAHQPSELEGRAALLEFAWNIRDLVSSNISMFEVFTPDQTKEFAVNMANAFEKFTLELEAVTLERDAMRRDLDECRLLIREREQCSLEFATSLAREHAQIATKIRSFQSQIRALSTALVLNSSCIMSVILPDNVNDNLSPVVQGDGSFQPLSVSLSMPQFPWPVSHFRVSHLSARVLCICEPIECNGSRFVQCVDAGSHAAAGSRTSPDCVPEGNSLEFRRSSLSSHMLFQKSCCPRLMFLGCGFVVLPRK